jgi:hypothetical protein
MRCLDMRSHICRGKSHDRGLHTHKPHASIYSQSLVLGERAYHGLPWCTLLLRYSTQPVVKFCRLFMLTMQFGQASLMASCGSK